MWASGGYYIESHLIRGCVLVLSRSMTHRIETEPVTSSTGLPTPSLPMPHPLRTHSHKSAPLPDTATCNHAPNCPEGPSHLSSPCCMSTTATSTPPVSETNGTLSTVDFQHSCRESTATNWKTGSHVTSCDDHVTSHVSHMTLRKRDAQCLTVSSGTSLPLPLPQESSKLIKPKIRHRVVTNGDCSPPGGQKFPPLPPSSKQDDQVLKSSLPGSGPARNLRFRPYTLGKT